MNDLQLRRTAAHVLNRLLRETYHLGQKAFTFQGDNRNHWNNLDGWQIEALIDGKRAALVYIQGNTAGIRIQSAYDIIRSEHYSDFNPADHGIEIDLREDPFDEDAYPDIHDMVEIGEVPGLDLPEMHIIQQVGGRKPRVICSR